MKKGNKSLSRRKFIEASAATVAGASIGVGTLLSPRPAQALGYVNGDQINPSIDNTRVVQVYDPAMTTGVVATTWASQNTATHSTVVAANIDKMACALAEEGNVSDAWNKMLSKPAAKTWSQVVVAIKTNCINTAECTRDAVMSKFASVLIDVLGVTPANIYVYDGNNGQKMRNHACFSRGVVNAGLWGGINTATFLPPPINANTNCVQNIANTFVDILINLAVCKGHGDIYGTMTTCMKNHFGTCDPNHSTNNLIAINKSQAILGAMDPVTSHLIYPAKQQLCFVDALWASQDGPGVVPDSCPNRLFMGTFAPVMDYLVGNRFRLGVMGWAINATVVNRFLSDFGYSDPGGNTLQMIDAMTWKPTRLNIDRKIKKHKDGIATDVGAKDMINKHMEP